MKLKLNSFLASLFVGSALLAQAQGGHLRCGHTQRTMELWQQNPQLEQDYQQLLQNSLQTVETNGITRQVYVIPVVFHIIHDYMDHGGIDENISDAQVYDEIAVLNRDYAKMNADTSEVVPYMASKIGKVDVEFRLATKDPLGNCTNGIEHIYSHETYNGDDFSKLNQWHRSQYLNVWVVRHIDDAAGYAFYPTDVEGTHFFADGIMILHDYVGRIGTSSEYTSRALTHEIGHWLGLSHTWGSTNDPNISCGDDGIPDTPITKGFDLFCPPTEEQAKICNPDTVENFQNYMDYSYCSVMFTKAQAHVMRTNLSIPTANRSNLWTAENLALTGTDVTEAPLCKPVADYSVDNRFLCEGATTTFRDYSWNAATTSRTWYFEDGSPATSTAANPVVSFSGLGWKQVKLVVSNDTGTDSVTTYAVHVSEGWVDHTGPYFEDFSNPANMNQWLVDNPEENYNKWERVTENGYSNSECVRLGNYKDVSGAQQFTNDYFYNNRLGNTVDVLVSPSYDLSTTSGAELSFEYAYATNGVSAEAITEELKVYASKDCGKTWILRKTLSGTDLLTAGNAGGEDFRPTTNSFWKTCTVNNLNIGTADVKTRFKFEFTASDVSNNLYLDNIRITGVLGIEESPLNAMDITVFPNPTSASQGISISYTANEHPVEFQLMDVQGKILVTESNAAVNTAVNHQLNVSRPLAAGCYYVKISQGEFSLTKKVVVL